MAKKELRCVKLGCSYERDRDAKDNRGAIADALNARLINLLGTDGLANVKTHKHPNPAIKRSYVKDPYGEVGSIRGIWALHKTGMKVFKSFKFTPKQIAKAREFGVAGLDPGQWSGIWKNRIDFEIEAGKNAYFTDAVVEEFNIACSQDIKGKEATFTKKGGKTVILKGAPLPRVVEVGYDGNESINFSTCPFAEKKVKNPIAIFPKGSKITPETSTISTKEDADEKLIAKHADRLVKKFADTTGSCCSALEKADTLFDKKDYDGYKAILNDIEKKCEGIKIPIKATKPIDWEGRANNVAWDRIITEKC